MESSRSGDGLRTAAERALRRLDGRAASRLALLLLPAALLAVLAWQHRWTSDDGFINLRIVQQMAAGNGPVFNAGERVEAGTSPLWLAILFVGDLLTPVRLEYLALVAALACSVGGLVLAVLGTRRLLATLQPERTLLLPLGALAFAVIPASWDYSTSALESGLGFGWLGASWWALTRRFADSRQTGVERATRPWLPALLGLGPLIRPDFAIMSAAFVVALLVIAPEGERGWKSRVFAVASAIALPLAYQIFRMGYYAALVPNTALAKEAGQSYWTQGWRYLTDFVDAYAVWIPIVVLMVAVLPVLLVSARRARARVLLLAPVVAGLLHALFWVRVGGDFMHARMLLPSMFCMLLPVATVAVQRATWIAGAVVVTWAAFCLVALRVPYEGSYGRELIADERGYYVNLANGGANPVTIDDYDAFEWWMAGASARDLVRAGRRGVLLEPLREPELLVSARPRARPAAPLYVRFGSVGIFGYAAGTDVYVADWYGLTDPITSRTELARRTRPGHEKRLDGEWLVARFGRRDAELPEGLSAATVADARRALTCAPLRDLLDAIDEPLDPGRFLSNIVDSFELSSLRFPPDARAAARQLCGSA